MLVLIVMLLPAMQRQSERPTVLVFVARAMFGLVLKNRALEARLSAALNRRLRCMHTDWEGR